MSQEVTIEPQTEPKISDEELLDKCFQTVFFQSSSVSEHLKTGRKLQKNKID
jgi:hypothetical protein